MSSGAPYPPPTDSGSSIYNPNNYSDGTDGTSVSTDESNVFTKLQYCSCAEPLATYISTVIPTTQWVQSAIQSASTNTAYVNVANTFSQLQHCSAVIPASTDTSNTMSTNE